MDNLLLPESLSHDPVFCWYAAFGPLPWSDLKSCSAGREIVFWKFLDKR